MTCPRCGDESCFQDVHHMYWPRRSYTTSLEKRFRELFTVTIWRCQHNDLHALTKPPEKPSVEQMRWVVERRRRRGRRGAARQKSA